MAAVLKTAVPERVSGVRIPLSPPTFAKRSLRSRLRLASQLPPSARFARGYGWQANFPQALASLAATVGKPTSAKRSLRSQLRLAQANFRQSLASLAATVGKPTFANRSLRSRRRLANQLPPSAHFVRGYDWQANRCYLGRVRDQRRPAGADTCRRAWSSRAHACRSSPRALRVCRFREPPPECRARTA
jgi:hypothetical protein